MGGRGGFGDELWRPAAATLGYPGKEVRVAYASGRSFYLGSGEFARLG